MLLSPVRDLQERARNKIEYYLILLSSRENQSFYEIKCNTLSSVPLAAKNFLPNKRVLSLM